MSSRPAVCVSVSVSGQ